MTGHAEGETWGGREGREFRGLVKEGEEKREEAQRRRLGAVDRTYAKAAKARTYAPQTGGGGGGGMATFGAERFWHQFLNTAAKFGIKFPDCGTRTSIHHECWILDGCCYLPAAVHTKSAKNESYKNGFGP